LNGSAYYFRKLTHVFTNYVRGRPPPIPTISPPSGRPYKRFRRNASERLARHLSAALHRRLHAPHQLIHHNRATPSPTRRFHARKFGTLTQPQERHMNAYPSRRPPGPHHRPHHRRIPRSTRQATQASPTSILFTWPRGLERSLATNTTPRTTRRESLIILPRHRAVSFFSARATRRSSHKPWMGGTRPTHA
jgi:hypothetical protein